MPELPGSARTCRRSGPLDDPLGALPAPSLQGRTLRHPALGRLEAPGAPAVRCLLNRERRRRGLRPLGEDARLLQSGQRTLARDDPLPASSPTSARRRRGRRWWSACAARHYLPARAYVVGENLAYGTRRQSTPASILRAWMHSTSHRANILATRFREVGVGIEVGQPGGRRTAV